MDKWEHLQINCMFTSSCVSLVTVTRAELGPKVKRNHCWIPCILRQITFLLFIIAKSSFIKPHCAHQKQGCLNSCYSCLYLTFKQGSVRIATALSTISLGSHPLIKIQTQEYANFTLHPREGKKENNKKGFIKKTMHYSERSRPEEWLKANYSVLESSSGWLLQDALHSLCTFLYICIKKTFSLRRLQSSVFVNCSREMLIILHCFCLFSFLFLCLWYYL